MAQLSFAVVSEDAGFGATAAEQLGATGHVEVRCVVTDPEELLPSLTALRPDALLADLGSDPQYVLELLGRIPAPRPILLVVGRTNESELILRAMRLGAKEFFPRPPSLEDLRAAVDRLVLEYGPQPAVAQHRAPVVAVMGAKGGVGATVVACQLAASLQSLGGRTALVDLNLPLGDVALHFDLQPRYTLANLARETERLDSTSLATILQGHRTGLQILAAPTQMEEAELVRGDHVESALGLLRADFNWIVLDVSRSWNEASVRALDLADHIVLVTLHDVPTLSHARAHLDLLKRLGHADRKIRIVANRFSSNDAVTGRDFIQFLGKAPDARLPNDYQTTCTAVNEGKPIGVVAPRSALHRAYVELAEHLHDWCGVPRPQLPAGDGAMDRIRNLLNSISGKGRHGTD